MTDTYSCMPKWVSLAIVAIIILACFNMLLILAPGLPLEPDIIRRMDYITSHTVAWQFGWLTWMISAFGLLLFCFYLLNYIPDSIAKYFAISVVAIGIVPDISAEMIYAFVLPWLAHGDIVTRVELFRLMDFVAMQLTGTFGNGAYNIGGLILNILLFKNHKLPVFIVIGGAPAWIFGLFLSISTALNQPAAAQIFAGIAMMWSVLWMLAVALIIYAAPQRYRVE